MSSINSQVELLSGYVLENLTSAVVAVDREGNITFFNREAERISGIGRNQALGRFFTEVFHEFGRDQQLPLEALWNNEKYLKYDMLVMLNGSFRTLECDCSALPDKEGAVLIFEDVSQRRRMEEELKTIAHAFSRERSFMRDVLNNLPSGVLTCDENLQINYINRKIEEVAGRGPDALINAPFETLKGRMLSEDTVDKVKNVYLTGETLTDLRTTLRDKKGRHLPVAISAYPLYNALRQRQGVLLIADDLQHKAAYERLERTSLQILGSIKSGVVAVDADCRIVLFNFAAGRLLQLDTGDVINRHLDEILGKSYSKLSYLLGITLSRGEEVKNLEVELLRDDEGIILIVNAVAVTGGEGEKMGAVMVLHDVTELRRTQAVVREREKLALIGTMAAGITHEVKNPLTSIRGLAQMMHYQYRHDRKIMDFTGIIIEEVDRTVRVITDFLQVARPKPPRFERKNLNSLAADIMSIVEPQANLSNVIVICETAPDIPDCLMDEAQMKQVLLNLCHNAIQAMPEGGRMVLRVGGLDYQGMVYISVNDSGEGISPDDLTKLGVPFHTTKESGTGLGLSISYAIVDMHGGRVEVDSNPGRGSTFTVLLPVSSP